MDQGHQDPQHNQHAKYDGHIDQHNQPRIVGHERFTSLPS